MDREQQKACLKEKCSALGISLTDRQIQQFLLYYDHLVEKNKVMNLTAVTEYEEVVIKHFADSLSLVRALPHPGQAAACIDVGTGAGFPGIPLKIVYPAIDMVLADSLQKRLRFLDEVISLCELDKIVTVHGRAEELGRMKTYREQFDLCVSRAVANLSTLCEYCLPFVKTGGQFISYKAGNIQEELEQAKKAAALLGGEIRREPVSFTLPGTDIKRTLIIIDKIKNTPARYPRKPGTPLREPL